MSPLPRFVLALATLLFATSTALAGGGARNVLVLMNTNAQESMEIGQRYARLRGIPAGNLCYLSTLSDLTVSQVVYQTEIETPTLQCIADSPHADRIDYIVVTRGLPIRATFPGGNVSLTALLQAMETSLRGKNQEFGPPYGFQYYTNPYVGSSESFAWSKRFTDAYGSYTNLRLCTMLSGYWSEDANHLVDRSLASDNHPPTDDGGIFFLEDGAPAADVRNADFPPAVTRLQSRGFTALHVTGADPEVAGQLVASHVNSGTYSGNNRGAIVSNTWLPGAIVDVFESYGLTPNNFTPGGADQVPATWWVGAGATGVHGTVEEPYNVAFPDGFMLEPYVDGYNLAEAWYQSIPYLYWMNLVLGDPLCAPWATPPTVTLFAPSDGATVSGTALRIQATSGSSIGGTIAQIEIYVDDARLANVPGNLAQIDWDSTTVADGWHVVSAIAYENDTRSWQGTASANIFVANRALDVDVTSPPALALVPDSFNAFVDATASLSDVRIESEGLVLGTASGGTPFTVPVDASLLGRGTHSLRAIATNAAGDAAWSAPVDVVVVKTPRFHSVTPNVGPQAGGTVVEIWGWNFEPSARAFFGALEATVVTWRDANHLTVTTPANHSGAVDVRVLNPLSLEGTLSNGFTYTPVDCTPDVDADDDAACDASDNCPSMWNPAQTDRDGDGAGDECDVCAPTLAVTGLRVTKGPGDRILLAWAASADACHASYATWRADDAPLPASFPADFGDATGVDQDGDAGGDASWLGARGAARLSLFDVLDVGTDGTPGPR